MTIGVVSDRPVKLNRRYAVSLSLLILLLLAFQYAPLTYFDSLGQWKSLPHSLIIVGTICLFPWLVRAAEARLSDRLLTVIPVLLTGIGLLASLYTYREGDSFLFLRGFYGSYPILLVVIGLGILRRSDRLVLIGMLLWFAVVTYAHVSQLPFDQIFPPGTPLWNVQHAADQLKLGHWIYRYGDNLAPVYPPMLFLPYLPFGLLGIDLRWASLIGSAVVFAILLRSIHSQRSRLARVILCAFFLSPFYVFNFTSTQLPFYWIFLTLFALAVAGGTRGQQRSFAIASAGARPLFFPLLPFWIFRTYLAGGVHLPSGWRLKRWRPALTVWDGISLVLLLTILIIILAAPADFLWDVFTNSASDGIRAVREGTLQPIGNTALTPLLPYAIASSQFLLLSFQGVIVLLLSYGIWRSRYHLRNPVHAYILLYAAFLSFNFVVYDYYWVDVLLMLLVVILHRSDRVTESAA